jgi:hypothetical protein
LLVKLFAKLPGQLRCYSIAIEECYPSLAELPRCGNDAHTYELIVHIDSGPVPENDGDVFATASVDSALDVSDVVCHA